MKWQWYRIQLILYMALSLGTIILFIFIQTIVNKGGVELVTMILNIFLSLRLFFNGFINSQLLPFLRDQIFDSIIANKLIMYKRCLSWFFIEYYTC